MKNLLRVCFTLLLTFTASAGEVPTVVLYQSIYMDGETSPSNRASACALDPETPLLAIATCAGESAAWLVETVGGASYVDRGTGKRHAFAPPAGFAAIGVACGPAASLPKTLGEWRSTSLPKTRISVRTKTK